MTSDYWNLWVPRHENWWSSYSRTCNQINESIILYVYTLCIFSERVVWKTDLVKVGLSAGRLPVGRMKVEF